MTESSKDLFGIMNDIVNGLKNVKISGNIDLSQIKREYRSIFGDEYAEDEKKEIIATSLNGRMKGLYPFLSNKGCCWIDFIGCDSFSNDYKKQIFFATVSINQNVYKKRKKFLSLYSDLVNKGIPIDIFVQLFFVNKEEFINTLNQKRSSSIIKRTLEKIQNDGFVIPLSEYDIDISDTKWSDRPLMIDVMGFRHILPGKEVNDKNHYYRYEGSFIKDVTELIENQSSSLALNDQMKMFLHKVGSTSEREDFSNLIKIVTKFNKSLFPKEVNFLYFIPNHCPDGAVGLFCYGANKRLCKKELNEVKLLSYNILYPYVVSYKSVWEHRQIVNESIKSAVSAIMSRNMSHNLGSHCMHYTKSALENLSGRLYGHGPEVRGAARLISYIQGRMDFLATLVSGEEFPYGGVNFKSQIMDILTVDAFSKRHYKASSTREKYKIIKQRKLQTSLEILSSQLGAIIRDRKERNSAELSQVVNATESLINQLENLKLDNADLRTTNFLLENLIKSEGFYRESIYDTPSIPQNITDKPFYLYVRYNGELFTGSEHKIIEEETVKAKLSELNIALPGGLMSTHAFYNIVENLIRNSAKHRATDLTERALITTIDVRDEGSKGKHRLRFTIFDNKHNASIAYPIIIEQLEGLQILNSEDGSINKKSKGLKEMLISALWLRSNEGEEVFSELLNKIEREKDGAKKLSLIKEYAYEIVKVDNQGNDSEKDDSSLGLRFYLPYFDTCATFKVNEVQGETISQGIMNSLREEQVKADIIVMDEREEIMQEAYKRFPRLYDEKTIVPPQDITIIEDEVIENKKANKVSYNETLMLYSIMKKRFGDDIIKYQVVFGESPKSITSPANVIYFQRHFNKSQDFSEALNFMYADSVSGGNFTFTLQDNFLRGQSSNGKSLTWKDKYFSYKIIESALTRITIIDERFSDDYDERELKSKNLRVLSFNTETPNENEIWSGSSFKDNDDYTLFLSIHLGLIEKVINNESNWFMSQYNKEYANKNIKRPERATFFMELLRRKFGKGKEIFISVHSGRGNYSYDLEHSLKEYPFINLSAIESVLGNSKYLLAQLFYNTIYIGKGEYNQKPS